MKTAFITGGSKGIGLSLVKQYVSNGFQVFSFARNHEEKVENVNQINVDLTNTADLQNEISSALAKINLNKLEQFTLINNAGRLGKISNLENIEVNDIANSIKLNVSVPLQLSSMVINALNKVNCQKTIINISSGAAVNPYQGWSVYCTSKAAIDMLTRNIALEQEEESNPFKCIGIRPGVVATNMQQQIRETNKEDFKLVNRFKELHNNDELYSTHFVAEKIFQLDTANSVYTGETVDVREIPS